jgi:hypothetical protein
MAALFAVTTGSVAVRIIALVYAIERSRRR